MSLSRDTVFKELQSHHAAHTDMNMRDLLNDQDRYRRLVITHDSGAVFDFSKHLVTGETLDLLLKLARSRDVEGWRRKMFAGEKINNTEDRAVLHTALRAPASADMRVDGENIVPGVHETLTRMAALADGVRNGTVRGATGKAISAIINIGIGGSDLGPRFVTEALRDVHDGPVVHFVSNVDGHAISRALSSLDPETTMIVVASKTFTTEETMMNAGVARDWLAKALGADKTGLHLVALSTAVDKAGAFGVSADRVFGFSDWVGGRYSLWSAIGFSIMVAIGPDRFRALLDGAHAADMHFRDAPLDKNIPVLMGVLGVWYRNIYGYGAHLLLPYDDRLAKLAKFIQQMDMESNGKSVDRDGNPVNVATGPVIFGEPGTDSQHSFMQLVHQGQVVPADFIAVAKPHHDLAANHRTLLANCFAQSRALAIGQTLEEANGDASRVFSGNRPSTTILLPELTPWHLGFLLALYEHKVFVQGIIWGLNSFDQPGVELGKKLAKAITPALSGENVEGLDISTDALIRAARR